MQLFISATTFNGDAKASGPFNSIDAAEAMFAKITKLRTIAKAECWNTNEKLEGIGKPILTYTAAF